MGYRSQGAGRTICIRLAPALQTAKHRAYGVYVRLDGADYALFFQESALIFFLFFAARR